MSAAEYDWLTLDDGEEVQWTGEPELVSAAGSLITGVLLLPLLGFGLLFIVPPYLRIKNTDYVVTNQSCYAKTGVLSTSIQSLELDRIQNTGYQQSFFEKQFGYGTVGVSTAGSEGTELEYRAIPDAREVQDLVRQQAKAYRGESAERDGTEDRTAGDESAAVEELVAELARTREAIERVEAAVRADRDGTRPAGSSGRSGSAERPDSAGRPDGPSDPSSPADEDGTG